jgi:hypothetical protein
MLLPSSAGSAAHPDLLLGGGKIGTVYLIDRDNMGKFGTKDQVVQELTGEFTGVYATAAYSGGLIDIVGPNGPGETFSIADGAMSPTPVSQSPDSYRYPGSTPSLSSNGFLGGINGIVWDIDRGTNELRAYSGVSYATEIYNSNQAQSGRDSLGLAVTFAVPTVANGRVFVGTEGGKSGTDLVVYGIISPAVAAPAAPTNLTVTTQGAGQIKLTWIDHDVAPNWADYFSVEMSTDGIDFSPVAYVSAGTTGFTIAGLAPGTTYDFRVAATNSAGTTDGAILSFATAAPPVQVTGLGLMAAKVNHKKAVWELVITFSGPLDARDAKNLAAYTLDAAKKVRRRGLAFVKPVPLVSSMYSPATNTVTLKLRGKPPRQEIRLTIHSALIHDPSGRPLEGNANGPPGGDFVATLKGGRVIALRTANRHWAYARAWLHRLLNPAGDTSA